VQARSFTSYNRPDPVAQHEWVQLADSYPAWFRLFAEEGLRNQLPAEYAPVKDLVGKAQMQNRLELDPREIVREARVR